MCERERLPAGRLFANRRIEVGIYLPQYGVSFDYVAQVAKEAERLGFDYIWVEDHLVPWYSHSQDSALECWTVLSALSILTRRIRLGSLCSCNSYRQPAMLAKTVAAIDVLSNGRVQFGIGPGWGTLEQGIAEGHIEEYEAYGIPFPRPAERVQNLRESISLIRRIWSIETEFVDDYPAQVVSPKPVQPAKPPLWVCGGGAHMLKLIAEMADGWNFGPSSPEDYGRKVKALQKHCQDVGRGPKLPTTSVKSLLCIGRHEEEALDYMHQLSRISVTKPQLLKSYLSTAIVGDLSQCDQKIAEYVGQGSQAFFFIVAGLEKSLEPLRLLSEIITRRD